MNTLASETVSGYPSGCVAVKDAHPETTLASAYSPVDYMSITSFPRLPEDDMLSGENALKSQKDDDNVLSEQETGESLRSDTVVFKLIICKSSCGMCSWGSMVKPPSFKSLNAIWCEKIEHSCIKTVVFLHFHFQS